MSALFLSRVRLRRDAQAMALAPLLIPAGRARPAAGHHLIWALFADGPDRKRDFLWREEAPGRFMILSARPPAELELFDVDSTPFAPALAAGDRLGFALRANAVVSRSHGRGKRGPRHDVVMDALQALPREQRAAARLATVVEAGRAWLARQGEACGFTPEPDTAVDGYDRVRIEREAGAPAVFGVMDFAGALRVADPGLFMARLGQGFGRARAFGCGLMLIRRLPPLREAALG
jgi:CRISPR system Cascade subunit CasE